jgi:hypothetical protein
MGISRISDPGRETDCSSGSPLTQTGPEEDWPTSGKILPATEGPNDPYGRFRWRKDGFRGNRPSSLETSSATPSISLDLDDRAQ